MDGRFPRSISCNASKVPRLIGLTDCCILLDQSGSEESFDHVLRSDESLKEKCEYIRQNPVRKGLIARPENYQWLWLDAALCGAAAPGREKLDS